MKNLEIKTTCELYCIQSKDYNKIYTYVSYLIILSGIGLRLYYYMYSKFFWQDEAWLFYALYNKDILSVFIQDNEFFQTYPSLFGVASWFAINFFGISTYVLRFIPFLASSLFFILLYIVARNIIDTKYAMICLSISLFNLILLNYCDEFKQYSIEADITLILLHFYLNNSKLTIINNKFIIISFISLLLSIPSPFIIATIIICYFINYSQTKSTKNYIKKYMYFIKDNAYPFLFLSIFSFIYYYFCLRSGDANNGNAWKNGMIPPYYTEWIEWICNNFFIILSKLLTNSQDLLVGHIVLVVSILGFFLLLQENSAYSKFIKVYFVIFIISLCRIYSLGNVYWGIQGARLSIYVLPIFILNAGFFVYRLINNQYKFKSLLVNHMHNFFLRSDLNNVNRIFKQSLVNINIALHFVVVVISLYISIWTIIAINDWNYNNYKSCNDIIKILSKNKNDVIFAHSSMWYSVEYYKLYKKCNFKIAKLGNQKTPTSEYPPKSIDFTPGFISALNELPQNKELFVFVPIFLKDKITRFISLSGCTIEFFNFDTFYILVCKKI